MRLIRPARNVGFAGGMNMGLRAMSGGYVLLTEDDLLLESGALAQLRRHLERNPRCGLRTGVLLNHERGTVRSGGIHYALAGVFTQTVLASGAAQPSPAATPYPVDGVAGAGMFARRAELIELGGFRDSYFMYYEDIELSARIRRRGRTIEVVPAARLRHFEAPAGPANPGLEFHKVKNLATTYILHAPARVLPEFTLRYGPLAIVRALARSPRTALPLVRAWLWVARHLPTLWLERSALRRADAAAQAAPGS